MDEANGRQADAAIVADIAALARQLAAKDQYRSASGPEALLAFADHLDGMLADARADRAPAVRVAVRKKRDR